MCSRMSTQFVCPLVVVVLGQDALQKTEARAPSVLEISEPLNWSRQTSWAGSPGTQCPSASVVWTISMHNNVQLLCFQHVF